MKKIDLHVHTTASDGTASGREAVRLAADIGLAAIAVTDHDTVSGYAEAAEAFEKSCISSLFTGSTGGASTFRGSTALPFL